MNTESTLQRLLRKRFTLKRRRPHKDGTPRDFGVGVTGVVVTIVILGILAAIGGPPLWRLITDAREHKLNSNLQEAAQVVRDRLTLEPEWMGTDGVPDKAAAAVAANEGKPTSALLTALVEDLPFTWSDIWVLTPGSDNDETIHIQFVADAAAEKEAGVTIPPEADWLLADWRAVRIQSANSDGAWACALIVLRPNMTQADIVIGRFQTGALPTGVTASADGKRVIDAWLGGIWYDSGEAYADGPASNQHCSPVGKTGGAPGMAHAWFPASANQWTIDPDGASTIVADRVFTRNL